MNRRDFLKISSSTSLSFAAGTWSLQAAEGLNPQALYAKFVPTDKSLDARWIESLRIRDHAQDAPIRYRQADVDLSVVGMTVGGIACGTVYLSGDGRLWVWDIFNQHHEGVVANQLTEMPAGLENINGRPPRERDGSNFLQPPSAKKHLGGVEQGFTIKIGESEKRPLNSDGWKNVEFEGQWPVGMVKFDDPAVSTKVRLKAYSPFIPLDLEDSSLPLTVMEYEVVNQGSDTQDYELSGFLKNPLGQFSNLQALRHSNSIENQRWQGIQHELRAEEADRADRVLFDFEKPLKGWKIEGTAFGEGQTTLDEVPAYQGNLGAKGKGLVNSHASAPGNDVGSKDQAVGKLTSPEFVIDRKCLRFLIGGGNQPEVLMVRLLVDGSFIDSATGPGANQMRAHVFDVSAYQGKKAQIEIIDEAQGGWGNIGADYFVLSDQLIGNERFESELDSGSMVLALIDSKADLDAAQGEVRTKFSLKPGESRKLTFCISWHLPNLNKAHGCGDRKRHYINRFERASDVVNYFSGNQDKLSGLTKSWVDIRNQTTLPHWLMDRSILPANTLQTQNCLIFDDGRFWAWEGIGCCPGTCGHVWQYSQAHARLFPEIERNLREQTDFKLAQQPDGQIHFRGTNNNYSAIDAQTSYVLRTLRDHQLSNDPNYLKRVWPNAKKALEYLIEFDRKDKRGGLDGLLDGRQHNTLDAEWYGKVHVLCSMYLAALRAGEELANDTGDVEFSKIVNAIYQKGKIKIETLFNGEFYIQEEDPNHSEAIGVGKGCYIDQVMGQFWANQVGLGRLYDPKNQKTALRSLWKYNFVPDYGNFRQGFKEGRHYGAEGDSGLLMCTWPKGGLRDDFKKHWQYAYFNEFMTGFEYQAAAHMIAERDEDLVTQGLAITRAIHDRYSAQRGRNPFNEIECSDHYARAGAAYAVFLAACGFHFDQSKGLLRFDPVIKTKSGEFKAPFTTSQAWGVYQQSSEGATIRIVHGVLKIEQLELPQLKNPKYSLNGQSVDSLNLELEAGDVLEALPS